MWNFRNILSSSLRSVLSPASRDSPMSNLVSTYCIPRLSPHHLVGTNHGFVVFKISKQLFKAGQTACFYCGCLGKI